jgi:AraC-like DNA-binding protein
MFVFSEKMSIFAPNYSAILMRTLKLITNIIVAVALLVIAASGGSDSIYRILLVGTLLICILLGYLLWRARVYNRKLASENRRLHAEIEQNRQELQLQPQEPQQEQHEQEQHEQLELQPEQQEQEQEKKIVQLQVAPVEEPSTEQQLFSRICKLMNEEKPYTEETLNRDVLAQMLCTNAKYVEKAIRQCSKGETVSDFINRYRLENVARLLISTSDPIAIIGELSGIPSRATLARLFRNAYGMTPSEYRNITPKT